MQPPGWQRLPLYLKGYVPHRVWVSSNEEREQSPLQERPPAVDNMWLGSFTSISLMVSSYQFINVVPGNWSAGLCPDILLTLVYTSLLVLIYPVHVFPKTGGNMPNQKSWNMHCLWETKKLNGTNICVTHISQTFLHELWPWEQGKRTAEL